MGYLIKNILAFLIILCRSHCKHWLGWREYT